MRMNRRNVLFVLGTTILLGGMLIGSGAFSQVEAKRTVTVDTAGDANAAIGIEAGNTYENVTVSGSDTGEVTIEFTNLNDNATFYYDDLLNITNNGGDGEVAVSVNTTADGLSFYNDSRSANSTDESLGTLQKGGSESVGFVIETGKVSDSVEITIRAESQS